MSRFDVIDLSRVPVPDAIQGLDYETILSERIADLLQRFEAAGIPFDVEALETDPAIVLQQEDAYRELLQLGVINDAVRAVLLASSWGTNLDNIGASFGVARMVVAPGDPNAAPPVPPTMEDDERYRRRIQLAPEAFATTGSRGAYEFHALSAHAGVADVSVLNHSSGLVDPGGIAVVLLPTSDDLELDVVNAVRDRLTRDDISPLTDAIEIRVSDPEPASIIATLRMKRGPDPVVVKANAEKELTAYLVRQRRIGETVALSGIYRALQVEDVERVVLTEPDEDIEPRIDRYIEVEAISIGTEFL